MSDEHPARAAARRSMEAVHARDKAAWVGNFADDGVVQDPIGPSPLDPSGAGHRGHAAIAAFWDKQIAPNRILFNIVQSYAAGPEVANVGNLTIAMQNGVVTVVNGVFTYAVDGGGKLRSLRAYWELPKLLVLPPSAP
jgi:steroid delta-isomerase